MELRGSRVRWLTGPAVVVAALTLAGACGQGGAGPESSESGAGLAEQGAIVVSASAVAQNRVAELRRRFRVEPVKMPLPMGPGRASVRPPEPLPVIGAGVATAFERHGERIRPVIPIEARRGVSRTASVELPVVASGSIRLEDDVSHVSVSFALQGATAAPVEVSDGIAVYKRGFNGADVIHRVTAEGTEDYFVFEERPAREELAYDIDVTGVAGLRLVSNTVELLDELGTPRLRVAPPYVVDRNGVRREARLSIDGCAFDNDARGPWGRPVVNAGASACVVSVAWSGVDYPVVVDPSWTATGSMMMSRSDHTATLLSSGKVLITGGDGYNGPLWSAELYQSISGTFAITGSMMEGRYAHTATLLGSGEVLITGGSGYEPWSAELYDEVSGLFTMTSLMNSPHQYHTATLLTSGKVLIAGGFGSESTGSAELYDPASGVFTLTNPMTTVRFSHTATLLDSGKVLIAGGENLNYLSLSSAELFNPVSATFIATGPMSETRAYHTATLLTSGEVLIAGGYGANGFLSSAELYSPGGGGTFAATEPMMNARYFHTATLLDSGQVLIAGGGNQDSVLSSTELYNPWFLGTFIASQSLTKARTHHTATLLGLDKVLVTGSFNEWSTYEQSAELFYSGVAGTACVDPSQCESDMCNNGICCWWACDSCTMCAAGWGGCAPIINADDPDSCSGPNTCDASGVCKLKNGQACDNSSACASSLCVDGVCCSGACSGSCNVCIAGTGACASVTNTDDSDTCTGVSTCDAAGMCKLKNGQACAAPTDCASGFCTDGFCCDTACDTGCQACAAALKPSGTENGLCGPALQGATPKPSDCFHLCNGVSVVCPASCVDDAECTAKGYCNNAGSCVPQKNKGDACHDQAGADCKIDGCRVCLSDHCNNGVCCNQACSGSCDVCAAVLGADEDGVCTLLPAGTPGKPACAGGLFCNGIQADCPDGCTADIDCPSTDYCDLSGACLPKQVNGAACAAGHECASGYCVDGVCCNNDCTGSCQACDVAPNKGACTKVTTGDPHPGHPPCAGVGTCAGTCDGSDTGCSYPAPTVECASVCLVDTETRSVCDGNGECVAGSPKTCAGGFACGSDGHCLGACDTANDCALGFACEATKCVPSLIRTCKDYHTLLEANEKETLCDPYLCIGGACMTNCTSVDDCVGEAICDSASHCVPPATMSPTSPAGCSCRAAGASDEKANAWLIAVSMALAALRRRETRISSRVRADVFRVQ